MPEFDMDDMRVRWLNKDANPQTGLMGTMQQLVEQCSYGKWQFAESDNVIAPIMVHIPCEGGPGPLGAYTTTQCRDVDRAGWAAEAVRQLEEKTNIRARDYLFKILMLPYRTACPEQIAALGAVNCEVHGANCWVWSFAEPSPRGLLHEMGHNMGFDHAKTWPSMNEYGDSGDLMGMGPSPMCWNAHHAHALGIAQPLATLTGADLPLGRWQGIRLPATFLTDTNFVLIRTDWMRDSLQARAGTVYLSYRLARMSETGLPSEMRKRVHIHSYVGPLGPADGHNYTMLIGTVTQGEQWPGAGKSNDWRLVVVAVSTPSDYSVPGMMASLKLCRYSISSSECKVDFTDIGGGLSGELPCNGDGACDPDEDWYSCPGDCPRGLACNSTASAVCGDGLCAAWAGENCMSCPDDCAHVPATSGPHNSTRDANGDHVDYRSTFGDVSWFCCGGGDVGHGCDVGACSAAGTGSCVSACPL